MSAPSRHVRARLAIVYAVVFLGAGAGLLALSYGLVASRLPAARDAKIPVADAQLQALCKQPGASPKLELKCRAAASAGVKLGVSDQRSSTLNSLLLAAGLGLLVATGAAAGLGWLVAGRVLRPGEQSTQRQRRFVANAAHELRTPLTAMRTAIEVSDAKPARTPEQLEELVGRLGRWVERSQATVDALLALSVTEAGLTVHEAAFLEVAAGDALDAAAQVIAERNLQLQIELESAPTTGDPVLLERMVANLIDNAVRYNDPGGTLQVLTGCRSGHSFVEVCNAGPCVEPGAVQGLFEPFARGGERLSSGGGVGLGLAIAAAIAAAHGAAIAAQANPDGGLRVTVTA